MHSFFIITCIVLLFLGGCLNLRCFYCSKIHEPERPCIHPLKYSPAITYCGDYPNATCLNITFRLQNSTDFTWIRFPGKVTHFTFKGCIQAGYCGIKKRIGYYGQKMENCTECNTDLCNSAENNFLVLITLQFFVGTNVFVI